MKETPPDYHGRITLDQAVLGGKPMITGTHIPVSVILNLLGNGYDLARIREAYPDLTEEDIGAAVAYAAARINREDRGQTGDSAAINATIDRLAGRWSSEDAEAAIAYIRKAREDGSRPATRP